MTPRPYQQEVWRAFLAGHDGLVNVPTGGGKTYAALFGPLSEIDQNQVDEAGGLELLYISPLRALSRDLEATIKSACSDFAPMLRVETRTGDSPASLRAKQAKALPHVLITTPESLALLLSYPDASRRFGSLRSVIVDEWHDLMSSKRGSLLELNLARLRALAPRLRLWGLSATIANLDEAATMLVGRHRDALIVRGDEHRPIDVKVLLPTPATQVPATGHYGVRMRSVLLADLDLTIPSIVFTNTRAQAEKWYALLSEQLPPDKIALHHGSMSRESREKVEAGLKDGSIRLAVATASLDLGVDFSHIERVYQIGSAKAVARLAQRAGRANHAPGKACEIRFLPTFALELMEIDAVIHALREQDVEHQRGHEQPFDVLTQFLVSWAAGDGFDEAALRALVDDTLNFAAISDEDLSWSVDFAGRGGETLSAYPHYRRFAMVEGLYRCIDPRIQRTHRMAIGTIVSESTLPLRLQGGELIGHVEERFVAGLRPGEVFRFAGRAWRFRRLADQAAYVVEATSAKAASPIWYGNRLAFSHVVTKHLRTVLDDPKSQRYSRHVLQMQRKISQVPQAAELLVETLSQKRSHHVFAYPFEGEHVNQALGVLAALRMKRLTGLAFQVTANDYGFELASEDAIDGLPPLPEIYALDDVASDLEEAIQIAELAKVQFREICQIAGLTRQNPGKNRKSARQMAVSSSLIYDVFAQFDPNNRLLHQARTEVKWVEFDWARLLSALERLQRVAITATRLSTFSPFALPLVADRLSASIGPTDVMERIDAIRRSWSLQ